MIGHTLLPNRYWPEPTEILRIAAQYDNERFLDTVEELFKLNRAKGES